MNSEHKEELNPMSEIFRGVYKPDILQCLANLSNDEVFTPPDVVNKMLDLLPTEVWSNPNLKFLDPACKTGVYLREITKRLIVGLEKKIPDLQKRIDHILQNMVYGIAITELTGLVSRRSLYCSKNANSEYSVSKFKTASGNVVFEPQQHVWENGRCKFCGASQSEYERDESLETHAYQFIHTITPEEIFNMKFDVIIGNPPYQLSDGGGTGKSARPIYHLFVEQAKKLNPKFISMIIPARWYAGGKGLDNFRTTMQNDKSLHVLVDNENSRDVFCGVDIAGGICYFLWDRDYKGKCSVSNITLGSMITEERDLNEFNVLIRSNKAIPIVRKILKRHTGEFLNKIISPRQPFGLSSTYQPIKKGIPCYFTQKIGKQYAKEKDVSDNFSLLKKWKLLIPIAPIAGQTDFSKPIRFYSDQNVRIAKPNECCTETYIVAGAFDSEKEVYNFKSYLFTKIVRFLLLQSVVSQNITRQNFCFVPSLSEYKEEYTDCILREKWGISTNEWSYIDSKIL